MGVVGSGLASHALALTSPVDLSTVGALPSACVPSHSHRRYYCPPLTPARQRSTSNSPYTSRLALAQATDMGLPCSAYLLARVLRLVPRRIPPRALVPERRSWLSP